MSDTITSATDSDPALPQTKTASTIGAKASDWFERIFRRGFTFEDLILYVLSLGLIGVFGVIFVVTQAREAELIRSLSNAVVEQWQPAAADALDLNHMRAQVVISAMRYHQGSITTAALSTRKNLGFLIGTLITIIGCNIVIRGVREGTTKINVSAHDKPLLMVQSASPGLIIALVGSLIIGFTLYRADERPEIHDDGIECFGCRVVTNAAGDQSGIILNSIPSVIVTFEPDSSSGAVTLIVGGGTSLAPLEAITSTSTSSQVPIPTQPMFELTPTSAPPE